MDDVQADFADLVHRFAELNLAVNIGMHQIHLGIMRGQIAHRLELFFPSPPPSSAHAFKRYFTYLCILRRDFPAACNNLGLTFQLLFREYREQYDHMARLSSGPSSTRGVAGSGLRNRRRR